MVNNPQNNTTSQGLNDLTLDEIETIFDAKHNKKSHKKMYFAILFFILVTAVISLLLNN